MKKRVFKICSAALLLCLSLTATAQTTGNLTFSFTGVSRSGYSGTKHALAVWIQKSDGTFVKTKMRYAGPGGGTDDHLPTYGVNAGGSAGDCLSRTNATDATTGATLGSYTAKTIVWDGKGVNGTANGAVVPDGVYQVTIETTWNHGTAGTAKRSFTFTKGPTGVTMSPANDANFTNISLKWTPTGLAVEDNISLNAQVKIYPSPSNTGLFNIDFKNEINKIKVIDILGKVVYNEDLTQSIGTTKTLDFTSFENGIYVINVSNDAGTSNYKVILDK